MSFEAFDWGPLLTDGPLFMGILNLTPDSFSDGGRFEAPGAGLAQARALIEAGARMLDLGAESTRPGARTVDPETEWNRLAPVLAELCRAFPHLPLSLDTRHAVTAERGLGEGAAVINDVTGFSDPAMLRLAADAGCGLIAMRSRPQGEGFHMPPYDDPGLRDAEAAIGELRVLRDRLAAAGLTPDRAILDPGFGFGTTFLEDLALWEALPELPAALDWPADRFCIGISRKRFLAVRAGTPGLPPLQRDTLTAEAHAEARNWGYRIFRTHAMA
ncbi:dihydropteroate synthase [Geothrix sp. 21YS21S-4]|uniref:dihydropteroate synthase n=1 Tax=Geothrix sp. 21YS21S-4 TaxID=3068889 RepID=UPI0027B96FEB|nr:dihydropteroate synthase [Geothrix sp. 21YS21S-4]